MTKTLAQIGALAVGVTLVGVGLRQGPRSLAHSWEIRLVLEHPGARHAAPRSRHVQGQLAFVPSPADVRPSWLQARGLDFIGVYDLNLGPIGFDIRHPSDGLLAGARVFAQDSVQVRLNPRQEHGGLEFVGRIHGDTISGSWYEVNVGGASGTFLMWRRE